MERITRVLVVDDSAYMRKVIRQMLMRSPFLDVVGTARDGAEALELVEQLRPDVVTVDLMMPEMDGLAFLREQMARRPVPVVVVSTSHEASEQVLLALEAGAVEVVQKPSALATEQVFDIGGELVAKVKAAAQVPLRQVPVLTPPRTSAAPLPEQKGRQNRYGIVVLGISTGGPQALKQIVPLLPASFPLPLVVVMHMPVGYTEMYARALDGLSALRVAEATQGMELHPGTVLIAPAGVHLTLAAQAEGGVVARLDKGPLDSLYRPSVDVLFRSAAEIYRRRVLGLVMTGMGADGREGAAWIKAQGGTIWTEEETSCVVYGMPRVVVEAGLSDRQLPLGMVAGALQEVI
ncbi:MAG TPA: chemotaxis-specific protein-glutamate methyltransferase CheB [Roseiflexaceae bacterium]|nr:chemotaxis-specific protein-glutamate methyltransferase CheB [Roseiflexaceae bacterium]